MAINDGKHDEVDFLFEFNRLSMVFQPDPTPDVRKKHVEFFINCCVEYPFA